MARPTEGPKGPTPEEIDEFVDFVNGLIDVTNDSVQGPAWNKSCQRLIEILDWAGEQVNKRRAYSKKFQLKDKERNRLLREKLGPDEYHDVIEEAKQRANAKLFEEVANEPASKRELAELNSKK